MKKKLWGVIFSYLLIVIDILVALFFVPYLLRGLGEDEYGIYRLLYSTASYLSVLDFGLGGTITRYIVKFKTEGDLKKQENFMAMGLLIYGLLAVITVAVSFAITAFLPIMYAASISAEKMQQAQLVFMILCGTHAITLFSHAYTGLFSAYERFSYTKVSSIIKIGLRVLLLIGGMQLFQSAMLVAVVDFALALGLLLVHILYGRFSVKCRIRLHKWEGGLAKEAMFFTSAILIQSIVNQFNTNVASVVLGVFTTTAVITMYSLVLQMYNMYSGFSTAISTVYLPGISAAVFKGADDDQITQKVIEPSRIQLVVLLLAASGFFLFGKDFILLWVGEGYDEVYLLTCILMFTSILNLSQNTITSVLKAKNKLIGKSVILAISTACNFGITWLLVPRIGAMGAVIGSSVSLLFGYGLALNIYYHKVIHLNMFTYYKKTYPNLILAVILSLPLGMAIEHLNPVGGWLGFIGEAGIYVVIFVIITYLIGLNRAEKKMIQKSIKKALAHR